jgi:hypothetical protein
LLHQVPKYQITQNLVSMIRENQVEARKSYYFISSEDCRSSFEAQNGRKELSVIVTSNNTWVADASPSYHDKPTRMDRSSLT